MRFDYYDRDINNSHINHQISPHENDGSLVYPTKARESFRKKYLHKMTLMFVMILVELLIVLLIIGYFISPLNRISHVTVNGNRTILKSSVITDIKAKPGNSVLRLLAHQNSFKRLVFNRNVQLKSMRINVHDWNHIYVHINEYPIVAYLYHHRQYFAVSNNGKRANQSTRPDQVDPLLFRFRSQNVLDSFIKSYKRVPSSIKPDIDKIYYSPTKIDPHRIHIYMDDGNQIYADFENWQQKIKYYSAISKSMKHNGIINLELGAYSKPFHKSNH